MVKKTIERVKLGIFVLTGLALLIVSLFILSKNRNLFGKSIEIHSVFKNVGGLISGNNVRYSGIDVGTVESVEILNDTSIEVVMVLDDNMKNIIKSNAEASIGTDGIIGNRIVNISPVKGDAPYIQSGTYLTAAQDVNTEAMLRTLDRTNQNIFEITEDLQITLHRFANSPQINKILSDETMSANIIESFANIRRSTDEIHATLFDLRKIVAGVREGKGSVGQLLRDTALAVNLNEAVLRFQTIEDQAEKITHNLDSVVLNLNSVVKNVDKSLTGTKGPAGMLLNDTATTKQLQTLVVNLNETSLLLNENMEALRHNFLFRGYFKKQEKEQKRAKNQADKGQ